MSITALEQFVFGNLSKVPPWVRATTYLAMVALLIYLAILPNFLNGHLRIADPNHPGQYEDYTIAFLRYTIEGRSIIVTPDDNGNWSIPLVSKIPAPVDIEIWKSSGGSKSEIVIPATQAFSRQTVKIQYDSRTEQFQLVGHGPARWLDGLLASIRQVSFLGLAQAQTPVPSLDDILQDLAALVRSVNDKRAGVLIGNEHLSKTLYLTEYDQQILKKKIEARYNIRFDALEWARAQFVSDLAAMIHEKLKAQ